MRLANAEERAYACILDAIATQRYAPGDHLSEAQIADELNMSRTPVRNALKKMTAAGILEYSRNVGCCIPQLTPHDMENVFSTRALLEGEAAEIAAKCATPAEIGRLEKLLEQEQAFFAQGEMANYTKINESLHLGIAAITKNGYLDRFISQLFWRAELYVIFFDRFYMGNALPEGRLKDPRQSQSCLEHEKLLLAIADRKPTEAREAMRAHLRSTYETITRRVRI